MVVWMNKATKTHTNAPTTNRFPMTQTITQWQDLYNLLNIEKLQAQITCNKHVASTQYNAYPLRITQSLVKRIITNNNLENDPILLQFLPQAQEWNQHKSNATTANDFTINNNTPQQINSSPTYTQDPLCEQNYQPIAGLIHKYTSRALLLVTADCSVNCRFCFRRHCRQEVQNWDQVIAYIENHNQLTEIILSGGEPLLLDKSTINTIIQRLIQIPHLQRLRIHSRLPITMPNLIDDELLKIIGYWHKIKPIVMVIHCNHPQELEDFDVQQTLLSLRNTGINLLNQTVLLRNINNNPTTLISLSEKLYALGVIPYYLHMLDHVQGAEHFLVDETEAKTLHKHMQENLSGYLVPKLVRDIVGAKFKVAVL